MNRPNIVETTAPEAAFLAGLSTEFWKNRDEIISGLMSDRNFTQNMNDENRKKLIKGWNRAVGTAHAWSKIEKEFDKEEKKEFIL